MKRHLFHTHFGSLRMVGDSWVNYLTGVRYASFVDEFGNSLNLPLSEVYVTR